MATALGAQLPACATGCSAPTRRCRRSAPHRLQVARASGNQGQGINDAKAKAAIENLDELLPPPPPLPATDNSQEQQQQQQQRSDDEGQEGAKEEGWAWFDRPASEKQTAPLRKTGMQPGASGAYLDSERLTRDPLELKVGLRTAMGSPTALPESAPTISRVLAGVMAVAGGAAFLGLPLLAADSELVAGGAQWQLLTASLQPEGLLSAAAAAAALLTAGDFAERRLGGMFAASFFAAGAASTLCCHAVSFIAAGITGTSALVEGAAPALLGPAAALGLAFLPMNWGALSGAQRRDCAAAALGLVAVSLTQASLLDTGDPLLDLLYDDLLALPARGAAVAAGLLLGLAAGPQLQVQRELDIEGMTITGDENEVVVVIDRRTAPQRFAAYGLTAAALWWLAGVAGSLYEQGLLQIVIEGELERLRALPPDKGAAELAARLFELAPNAFPEA